MHPFRFAALASAAALSFLLSGCGPGRLHILIPDFLPSQVKGLRLFRVLENGGLQAAGRIRFGALTIGPDGWELEYTQIVPGQAAWGPLTANVRRPARGQLELEMAFYNAGEPSFFRFASYNENGSSELANGEVFAAGVRQ